MSKHTPGPWKMHDSHGLCVGADNRVICDLEWSPGDMCPRAPNDEQQANAQLIAAAPELLEALRDVLRFEYDSGDGNQYGRCYRQIPKDAADRIRAAIAKAEGTQPSPTSKSIHLKP